MTKTKSIIEGYAVDGTTGTPLGGFGTGAVKFCAHNGTFAAVTQAPADQNDYKSMGKTSFQFFSERDGNIQTVEILKATSINGRYEDDAIWPEHLVNFGVINDIQLKLKAFSPLDNINYDNMSMPYAFYEFTLKNNAASEAVAACAFQVDIGSGAVAYVDGKGFKSAKWAVYAKTNDSKAEISVGSDNGFFLKGQCNNSTSGTVNRVAVKVKLAANETKIIKFALAWYDNTDPERSYYLVLYEDSGSIAELGLKNFETLKANAEELVTKMRSSNLPDWLKNQTLNTLVNLTNNSMYKRDGRVAFAEGEWTCFGTMDQMWHARQIVNQMLPYYAWQELNYWARTQKDSGQIHHDFNGSELDKSKLVSWDDKEHVDYRDINKWVDLNCGFIISIYETYKATADQEQLDYLWTYMKKAAGRVLDQVELYGNKTYTYTFDSSENSYDAGGNPNPFNASISAVAYKVMTMLAAEKGENELVEKYQEAYEGVVSSFRARYINDEFPTVRGCESYFAGQWLSMHLKLGEIWSQAETDEVLKKLDSYYHPYYWGMGNLSGTYNEWTPYLLTHYGGLLLNTRRANQWVSMQKDSYNRQYNNRNYVFNHPLDILPAVTTPNYVSTMISGDKQYISMPGIWRNYYDIVGYHRDKHTKDIWIKPIILEEMNHEMKDAMFISTEGYGSISCTESGDYNQNQNIIIKFDNPVEVSNIHLSDNFGENVAITINGLAYEFTRSGSGYAKELLVTWNRAIDKYGINIVILGDEGLAPPSIPEIPSTGADGSNPSTNKSAYSYIEAESASEIAGVTIATPIGSVWYVTDCNNFDYIKFDNVIFDEVGSRTFIANISSTLEGSRIEVVLDSVGGEVVGICPIPNTGGEQEWKEVACTIKKTTGMHNVILKFYGNTENNLMNINKIKFLQDDGRLDRTGWSATASINSDTAYGVLDGDMATNWHTSFQKPGDYLLIDMKENKTFDKITLDNKTNDYPRGYEVLISTDGTSFESICTGLGNSEDNRIEITFNTVTAAFIKIVLTEEVSNRYWTVYEMNVWNTKSNEV
jgi:hypothetical protein